MSKRTRLIVLSSLLALTIGATQLPACTWRFWMECQEECDSCYLTCYDNCRNLGGHSDTVCRASCDFSDGICRDDCDDHWPHCGE